MRTLEGRVAVVTGAASGIGRALAHELGRRGCALALVDVNAAGLEETAAQVTARAVSVHVTDVGDRAQMEALPAAVTRTHGAVHVLVNNAGVSLAGRFSDCALDDIEWLMRINFSGVLYGCHAFLPVLRAQDEAHIANMCSSFGLLGMAGKSAYCASKFAVRGLTEALAAECRGTPVGVTAIYPGPVDTGIIRAGRAVSRTQQDAEAAFLARRAISGERVARRIARAIIARRSRVLVGADYHLIDWATRLSPEGALALTARLAQRLPF